MGANLGGVARVRARLILAAVALVVGLGSASTAEARGLMFGFSDGPENVTAARHLIREAGGDVARVPLAWGRIERRPGHLRREIKRVYRGLVSEGVTPLFSIYGAATWAQNHYEPGVQVPDDRRAWRRLWRQLANRFPRAIWQVWNEPNHPFYGEISPRRIAGLTRSAARAVHSVAPRAMVLGPPVAPIRGWRPYMRRLYRRLGPRIGVSVNLYPRNPRTWRSDFRHSLRYATRIAGRQHLWITETGLSRATYGRERQARGSVWLYRQVARTDAAGLIFHRLAPERDLTAWDRGMTMTNRRLRPLPVFEALRVERAAYERRSSRAIATR